MHIVRTLVIVAILVTAVPAAAQESHPNRTRTRTAQTRGLVYGQTGYYGRFIYGGTGYGSYGSTGYGYYGGIGRRFYGGTSYPYYGGGGYGYPVWPRTAWIASDYDPEGKPLGLDSSAYGDTAYNNPSWNSWPYYANGRDEAPPAPATPKAKSESAVLEGRYRWRAGDISGALANFKIAVAEDLTKGGPRLHMALGLLATGDLRNADKAVASALEMVRAPEELTELGFTEWFRNPKERAKFEDKLFPARDGTGSITIALAWHLLGDKAKAAKALEGLETPAAKKLGDLIR